MILYKEESPTGYLIPNLISEITLDCADYIYVDQKYITIVDICSKKTKEKQTSGYAFEREQARDRYIGVFGGKIKNKMMKIHFGLKLKIVDLVFNSIYKI